MADTHSTSAEEWRPVVGWEGWYEVSTLGAVRRVPKTTRFDAGHVLGQYLDNDGRRRVKLRAQGRRADPRVYQLVAAAFLGPCPVGLEVNHKDHDKTNDVLTNLEYATRSQNMKHSHANGRPRARGIGHGRARLGEADVLSIRTRRTNGESASKLSREYKVSRTQINRIAAGKHWRHVPQGGASSQT